MFSSLSTAAERLGLGQDFFRQLPTSRRRHQDELALVSAGQCSVNDHQQSSSIRAGISVSERQSRNGKRLTAVRSRSNAMVQKSILRHFRAEFAVAPACLRSLSPESGARRHVACITSVATCERRPLLRAGAQCRWLDARNLCIGFFPFVVSLSNHSCALSKQGACRRSLRQLRANGPLLGVATPSWTIQ
jgi:hypothetical protein